MTEPRDPPLPMMEPITAFGMPVVPPASVGTAIKRPRSRFGAMGDVSRYEWDRTRDRWTLPGELWDEAIDIEQFRGIVGERDIPFTPGITAAEAERRRDLFEYEKREALYETHPISQFLAAIPPTVLDPVSVGTMPIGGVNFKLAKEAAGWLPFLRQTAIGGAKAGAASIVPEYMIQQAETGMIEPGRLIGSAIGPVIAAPVLGAAGRALSRGYQGVRTRVNGDAAALGHRAANSDPRVHPLDKEAAVLDAEERGLPTPYIGERTSPQPVPMQRLRETFADYEGGWRGFVRDLGARRDTAVARMRRMGLGPDNEVAIRLLRALGDDTDARAVTPVDYNIAVVDLINLFRAGEILDVDQIRMLIDNGLVKLRGRMVRELPRVRLVPGKVRMRPGEPQKPRFRVLSQEPGRPVLRITGVDPGRVTVRPNLEGGKPRVRVGDPRPRVRVVGERAGKMRLRASPNKPRFRYVVDQGKPRLRLVDPGGEKVRFVADDDGAELSVLGRRIVEALTTPDRPVNRRVLEVVRERGIGALRELLRDDPRLEADLDVLPRILSEDSIDAPTVMHHLDAAALRSQVPDAADLPPPPAPPPAARPAPDEVADAATLDAKALARELGVDVNDIDEAVGGLFDGVTVCGR